MAKSGMYGRLIEDLRRDKKKAVILASLTVVALFMFGRVAVQMCTPAKAAAATATPSAAPTPAQEVKVAPVAKTGIADAKRDFYLSSLSPRITRDLFAVSDTAFPPVAAAKVETVMTPAATQPAEPDVAEIERKATLAQAQTLKFQGVIVGSNPAATISDKVVRLGGSIQGFEVESISEDFCILRKKDIRIKLLMKQEE